MGTLVAGCYELHALVGEGGMGAVYDARHRPSGQRVALKILRAELGHDRGAAQRFLREARAVASVPHRHIVEVYQTGYVEDGAPFYAMTFLDGETLAARLYRKGRMAEAEAAHVLAPILDALHHVHRTGVVHRDVKPENIFLARAASGGERPVLMDFGVAAFVAEGDAAPPGSQVVGTPAYMAPEQAAGGPSLDPRTDIYAAGVTLYELLTGLSPYQREDDEATLRAILNEGVRSPSRIVPEISPAMEAVILCAMARDPQHRFPSAETFGAALQDALAEPAGSARLQQFALARTVIASRAADPSAGRRRRGGEFADNRARTVMIVLDKDGTPSVADAAGQSLGGPSAAPQPQGPSAAQPSRTLSLVASAVIFLLGVAVLLFALVSRGILRR